jgi:hypothetical protein
MGLSPSEALRLAHASGLIPSAHPPRATSLKSLAIKLRESLANKAVIFGRSAGKFANFCDSLSAIHRTKALINRGC